MTSDEHEKFAYQSEVHRRKLQQVYEMVPEDGPYIKSTDLEKKKKAIAPGMSNSTLHNNINELVSLGYLKRKIDETEKPPGVYFARQDRRIFVIDYGVLIKELDLVMNIVKKGGIKALEVNEAALKANLSSLRDNISITLLAAGDGKQNRDHNIKEFVQTGFTEQLYREIHEELDKHIIAILRPWMHKILDLISVLPLHSEGILAHFDAIPSEQTRKQIETYNKVMAPFRTEDSSPIVTEKQASAQSAPVDFYSKMNLMFGAMDFIKKGGLEFFEIVRSLALGEIKEESEGSTVDPVYQAYLHLLKAFGIKEVSKERTEGDPTYQKWCNLWKELNFYDSLFGINSSQHFKCLKEIKELETQTNWISSKRSFWDILQRLHGKFKIFIISFLLMFV